MRNAPKGSVTVVTATAPGVRIGTARRHGAEGAQVAGGRPGQNQGDGAARKSGPPRPRRADVSPGVTTDSMAARLDGGSAAA